MSGGRIRWYIFWRWRSWGWSHKIFKFDNSVQLFSHSLSHFSSLFFTLRNCFRVKSKSRLKLSPDCLWRAFDRVFAHLACDYFLSICLCFWWNKNKLSTFSLRFSTAKFKFQFYVLSRGPGKNLNMICDFCIRSIRTLYLKWRPTCTTKAQPRGFWDWRGTALYATVNICGKNPWFSERRNMVSSEGDS